MRARGGWELESLNFTTYPAYLRSERLYRRRSNLPLVTGSVNAEALTAAMQVTRYPETTTAVHTAITS